MYSLELGHFRQPEGHLKRLVDRLPGRRKAKEEREQKDELVSAFVTKVFADIDRDGFTVFRRFQGSNGYESRITNSTVIYRRGENTYPVLLTAVKNMPGDPEPHVSIYTLSLSVEDGVILKDLPSGECRHGHIYRNVYPSTPEHKGTKEEGETHITGNAFFHKVIKHDNRALHESSRIPSSSGEMSFLETKAFLEELLLCSVDTPATEKAYEEKVENKSFNDTYFHEVSSIHWNRDVPEATQRFFADQSGKTLS